MALNTAKQLSSLWGIVTMMQRISQLCVLRQAPWLASAPRFAGYRNGGTKGPSLLLPVFLASSKVRLLPWGSELIASHDLHNHSRPPISAANLNRRG